jgi:hypothetical protein
VNALVTWVRLELRRRARSLVVLALLVALATATVMTAVAGARRGSTAVERLLERTRPATVAVLPNDPAFDWGRVAELPGVEALARFPISAFGVDDLPPYTATDFVYQDATIMESVERPVVLEGRLADPARDDEVVVTSNYEGGYGKRVGDTVTLQLLTPEQIDEAAFGAAYPDPEGPEIEAEIVGVVRSGWFSDTPDAPRGRVIPSVGFFEQHQANLLGTAGLIYSNALVRLEQGAAGIPEFRERLAEVSGRRDIEFFDLVDTATHYVDVSGFEARSLLAFALAAAIAAVFLIGQSVARYAAGTTADLQVLRAFGMPPGQLRIGTAAGPAIAAVVGAAMGAVVSVSLSPRFPLGTAAPFEPDPGSTSTPSWCWERCSSHRRSSVAGRCSPPGGRRPTGRGGTDRPSPRSPAVGAPLCPWWSGRASRSSEDVAARRCRFGQRSSVPRSASSGSSRRSPSGPVSLMPPPTRAASGRCTSWRPCWASTTRTSCRRSRSSSSWPPTPTSLQ